MPSHHAISFDRTVDLVDEYGVARDGSEPIDDALGDALTDGSCVELPPGEYLVTEAHRRDDLDRIGVRGTGTDPADVRFVFPSGNEGASEPANYVLLWLTGNSILVENFEIHQTRDRETAASLVTWAEDRLELHDLTWQGWNPISSHAKGTCLYPSVGDEAGQGRITGITIQGGGVEDTYPNRRMGILFQRHHTGDCLLRDIDIRELGSSAIRATRCPGRVRIEDSHFENNDNASIRFGAGEHPSGPSHAKNCTVVVDRDRIRHLPGGETYEGVDGVRIDANGQGWSGALVEECDLVYRSLPTPDSFARGAIARPSWGDHGGFTVRDCTIRLDADGVPAVAVKSPGDGAGDPAVTLEDVHITGSTAANDDGAVVSIADSPNSRVRDSCIDVPSGDLDGVHITGSGSSVTDSSIRVGGDAVVGDATAENVDDATDCRTPSESGDDTLPHELVVRGTGSKAQYRLVVDGDLVSSDLEPWDDLTGSEAVGWVTDPDDVDTYRFSGTVMTFELVQGDSVSLTLNGESVTLAEVRDDSPAEAPSETVTTSTITVTNESAGSVEYRFDVDGDVLEAPNSATILPARDGRTPVAATTRTGWTQTYRIRGSVVARDLPDGVEFDSTDG